MKTQIMRGSEWRKWDLHVHAPTTRLANSYTKLEANEPDWARFCRIVNESDITAIGITDYFSFDSFFEFKTKYKELYPDATGPLAFPNLELRLNQAVHKKGAEVNIHLILPPDLSRNKATSLLHNLELYNRPQGGERNYTCHDALEWPTNELKGASTTLEKIRNAIIRTFDGANSTNLENYALIVASGRDDGLSPGSGNISPRKEVVIDVLDEGVHAIFARGADSGYWLREDRIASEKGSVPRPTFGGCDAHSFEDLEKMLGKTGNDTKRHWETTWIKADLSWDGLLQTLAEPASRVQISDLKPDSKDDYRIIESVVFSDNEVFPERLVFNDNLNAIIGSRSSGKSSLLAHIAHAVDPEDTEKQQSAAEVSLGPAAGHKWSEVQKDYCHVLWKGGGDSGRVVYIPQNFLNKLSDDPLQVTKYIIPSVKAVNPSLFDKYEQVLSDVKTFNNGVESHVNSWFDAVAKKNQLNIELGGYGSEEAINSQIKSIEIQIEELRKQSNLTDADSEKYRSVESQIASLHQSNRNAENELVWLRNLARVNEDSGDLELREGALEIEINFNATGAKIPDSLAAEISEFQSRTIKKIEDDFTGLINRLNGEANDSFETSIAVKKSVEEENKALFERFKANSSISKLEADLKGQKTNLDQRAELEKKKRVLEREISSTVQQLKSLISNREEVLRNFVQNFNEQVEGYGGLDFTLECDFDEGSVSNLISKFDRSSSNEYISGRSENVSLDIKRIHAEVGGVLEALEQGKIKIKRAETPRAIAKALFTESPDLRFAASLDNDVIGGFSASTMTPGKQSLFALTLILSDAGEDWPLLIDQPEDDLDSRSIYREIVEFLKKQKQRRQILMVTHNANLVVGADAECVIVANRHGDDRRNVDNRTFDYVSGSLEHSYGPDEEGEYELLLRGIREHVVELLDGGTDAFKKRQNKYKLKQ